MPSRPVGFTGSFATAGARRAGVAVLAACLAAATGCGDSGAVADAHSSETRIGGLTEEDGSRWPEDLAERARGVPGIDDVSLVYNDPDGNERDALPDDPDDRAGWVARIDIVHDVRNGVDWASEAVAGLVARQPAAALDLEIWLHPVTLAEVSALAHPRAADGSDPVRDAYLLGATPGVVRAVFDGRTADVRVRDDSDLLKVGDVAAAHGVKVETVWTADGESSLDVATVQSRPPHVVVAEPWPDNPGALNCDPDVLHLSILGTDAATGHRALVLAATNTGDAACVVEGYPLLTFRALDERLDVTVTHGPSFMARDAGPTRIVIPVGARALAVAGWNAMPTAEYPDGSGQWPDVTAEVLLDTDTGATPVERPLTSVAITPDQPGDTGHWRPITTLDIVDGGEVTVTAWAPDDTAF